VEPITDELVPGRSLDDLRQRARRHPGSFQARLDLGKALFEDGNAAEAEGELRAALRLFPEYGGADSPWLFLARIHRDRGELEEAADAFHALGQLNEGLWQVHVEEATARSALGQSRAAAAALESAVEVFPYDVDTHLRLAELYDTLENGQGAVRERRAILALDPVDRADAHYQLAAALSRAGDRVAARSEVLKALEIAPNFQAALDLLLELRGGTR
jgi:tetratricopeptide (TPR) repeat protein